MKHFNQDLEYAVRIVKDTWNALKADDFMHGQPSSSHGVAIDELEGISRNFFLASLVYRRLKKNVEFLGELEDFEILYQEMYDTICKRMSLTSSKSLPRPKSGRSNVVLESAAMCLGLMINFNDFWSKQETGTRGKFIEYVSLSRNVETTNNNWVIFPSIVRVFLAAVQDGSLVNDSAKGILIELDAKIEEWYIGDGWYSDGPGRTLDYYASWAYYFYMPTLISLLEMRDADIGRKWKKRHEVFIASFCNFFSSDGSYVLFGRSLSYKFGVVAGLSSYYLWKNETAEGFDSRRIAQIIVQVIERANRRREFTNIPIPIELGNSGVMSGVVQRYSGPYAALWAGKAFIYFMSDESYVWKIGSEFLATPESNTIVSLDTAGFLIKNNNKTHVIELYNHGTSNAPSLKPNGLLNDALYSELVYTNLVADGERVSFDIGVEIRHWGKCQRLGRGVLSPIGAGINWMSSMYVPRIKNPIGWPKKIQWHLAPYLPVGKYLNLKSCRIDYLTLCDLSWSIHVIRFDEWLSPRIQQLTVKLGKNIIFIDEKEPFNLSEIDYEKYRIVGRKLLDIRLKRSKKLSTNKRRARFKEQRTVIFATFISDKKDSDPEMLSVPLVHSSVEGAIVIEASGKKYRINCGYGQNGITIGEL